MTKFSFHLFDPRFYGCDLRLWIVVFSQRYTLFSKKQLFVSKNEHILFVSSWKLHVRLLKMHFGGSRRLFRDTPCSGCIPSECKRFSWTMNTALAHSERILRTSNLVASKRFSMSQSCKTYERMNVIYISGTDWLQLLLTISIGGHKIKRAPSSSIWKKYFCIFFFVMNLQCRI